MYIAISVGCLALYYFICKYWRINRTIHSRDWNSGILCPILLFSITFVSRMVYCWMMEPHLAQVSDFRILLNEAISGEFTDRLGYYRLYVHKLFYPYLLHALGLRTQWHILLFQCFCVSWIPVILYCTGEKIGDRRIGLLAGIIYVLYPTQLLYLAITTEEHMAALIISALVYWIICLAKRLQKTQRLTWSLFLRFLLEFFLFGILCGVCSCFKDWAIVMIVAILISIVYLLFKLNNQQRLVLLIGFLLIVMGRSAAREAAIEFAERLLGVKATNGVVSWQFFETMDPAGPITWNEEKTKEYAELLNKYDYDFELVNKEAMSIISKRIKEGIQLMPSFLLRKGRSAYADEGAIPWIISRSVKEEQQSEFSGWLSRMGDISSIYFIGIVLCVLLAGATTKNKYLVFCLIVILGGVSAGLLIEGQGRYKYSIEPLWCFVAANGLYRIRGVSEEYAGKP